MLCMAGPHPLVMHVSGEPWFWLGAADTIPLKLINRNSGEAMINIWPNLLCFKLCQPSRNSVFAVSSLMPFYRVSVICWSYQFASQPTFLPSSHLQGGWHLFLSFTDWQLLNQTWLSVPLPGGNRQVFSEYAWGYRHPLLCKCGVVSGRCSYSQIGSSKRNLCIVLILFRKEKTFFFKHSL